MALYSPRNLGEKHPSSDKRCTVKGRFENVKELYSERAGRLFPRWIELDSRFQALNNQWKRNNPNLADGHEMGLWKSLAAPVLGGANKVIDSIAFQPADKTTENWVKVQIGSTGPMGDSSKHEDIVLTYIWEKRRLVIDDVSLVCDYRHSYLRDANYTRRQNLDQYIDSRCESWQSWIENLKGDRVYYRNKP